MMFAAFTYSQELSVRVHFAHLQGTDRFIAIAGNHVPEIGQTGYETQSALCPTLRQRSIEIHLSAAAGNSLREVVQ